MHVRKQDPSRAAALPETLPLEGKTGSGIAFSATSFDELPLDQYLARHLTGRMGLAHMTPVQQHAVPTLLSGGDLLVRSPTGSGKTLAYAVPIVQSLVSRGASTVTRAAGTFAIILVPTRELCLQTHEVVRLLTTPFPSLVTSTLMGGERKKAEKGRLRKGVAVLVGTPGRIADHVQTTQAWQLGSCRHLVLDEADRLLDLGFRESIDTILEHLEKRRSAALCGRRQTVLLSATLTKGLRELAGRSLSKYATLSLTHAGARFTAAAAADGGAIDAPEGSGDADDDELDDGAASGAIDLADAAADGADADADAEDGRLDAPSGLVQSYALVPTKQRLSALLALLRSRSREATAQGGDCKMVVFVSSCDGVDFL